MNKVPCRLNKTGKSPKEARKQSYILDVNHGLASATIDIAAGKKIHGGASNPCPYYGAQNQGN